MKNLLVFMFLLISIVLINVSLGSRCPSSRNRAINVAAFNIKGFGQAKMRSRSVASAIVDIVERYDIICIQEVRDSSGSSVRDLWRRLNSTDRWGMVISERLGRTSYKEQYLFFYRLRNTRVLGTYQIPDSRDVYEREPFSVYFKYKSPSVPWRRVVLMALHTKPFATPDELDQLPASMRAASRRFRIGRVVAMGDFNADCSYATERERAELEIFQSRSFRSLIPDWADTTQASTDCAYDRVVVYGRVNAKCATVYNFQAAMGMSSARARAVSDHYPVEFELY